ncbi:MAG: tripartite tricarboxylate transporter permease, partial [Burkholderiaceae bacterium]
ILGELMEEYLRRALTISRGDWNVFIDRPLSATLLAIAVVLLIIVTLPFIRKKREEAFQGED